MEHTVAVNKKVITIRICIYAVCIVSWFIVVLLTGLHTGFHTFFITAFLAFMIFRNIRKIRKYNSCITSEDSAVKIRPVSDEVIFTVLTPLAAVFIFFFTIIFTLQIPTINSFSPSQYKFSKLYIEKAGGTKTDLLPVKLPEKLTYYNLRYFPGFAQASTILTLDLTTDDKGIAEIQSEAEKLAVASFDLEKYNVDNENEEVKAFKEWYFKPDDHGYTNDTIRPRTGAAGKEDGRGTIYIISSNGDWNHQHTKSITINFDTNTVTFGA